ncbi:MAG: 4'-phosphopantetheinyl transferase superfamily protein [Bacteroidales bacterium]|nr:4'-phosphopantetheinyl transferase superfamily protein [Bacteroidales bacterium]
MSLSLKKNIDNYTRLGVWDIQESLDDLLLKINLTTYEKEIYNSFNHDLRKLHWLSARAIIKELLPHENIEIIYNSNDKPFIKNKKYNISISHSYKKAAVIISKKYHVGIDIEKMQHKIEKLKEKFLSEKEIYDIGKENIYRKLYIYWGAKESLFKIYGKGNIIFAENLFIEPFEYKEKGQISGHIILNDLKKKYRIFYEAIDDYMLVYAME